jgi:hypothetical protein
MRLGRKPSPLVHTDLFGNRRQQNAMCIQTLPSYTQGRVSYSVSAQSLRHGTCGRHKGSMRNQNGGTPYFGTWVQLSEHRWAIMWIHL